MEILICIDDTDNIEKDISTGAIAQMIQEYIEKNNLGRCSRITRHQLLLHENIPYTSHNSSMCFEAEIDDDSYDNIVDNAIEILEEYQAPGSDPGLCIVKKEMIKDRDLLIDFGHRAKKEVLTKEEAYKIARKLNIHLTEHGGTGLGIIGALAGAGLRWSGNDGEFRGKVQKENEGKEITVSELEDDPSIDQVRILGGEQIDENASILLGKTNKTILWDNKSILLVKKIIENENIMYKSCSKQDIRNLR